MNILLVPDLLTLNFFGDGDPGVFHIDDSCLVSGSYVFIHVSSAVTIGFKKSDHAKIFRSYNELLFKFYPFDFHQSCVVPFLQSFSSY